MPTRHQAASPEPAASLDGLRLHRPTWPALVRSHDAPSPETMTRRVTSHDAPRQRIPVRASPTFTALGPEAKRATGSLWSISGLVVRLSQKGKKPYDFKDLRGEPRHQTPNATVKPRNFSPSNPPRLLVLLVGCVTSSKDAQRQSRCLSRGASVHGVAWRSSRGHIGFSNKLSITETCQSFM